MISHWYMGSNWAVPARNWYTVSNSASFNQVPVSNWAVHLMQCERCAGRTFFRIGSGRVISIFFGRVPENFGYPKVFGYSNIFGYSNVAGTLISSGTRMPSATRMPPGTGTFSDV